MRRAGFLIIAMGAVAALLATAEPADARLRFGLRAFAAPFGMLRGIAQISAKLGMALEDPLVILVRLQDGIQAIQRSELQAKLTEGSLDGAAPVLDLALLTLGDLRQGKLERPLASTWIGRKYARLLVAAI